jgi:capsular polysaccharide biosynthesis protein
VTVELDHHVPPATGLGSYASETDFVLAGRLVSFRYLLSALRRRRKVWLWTAAIGLVVGTLFHVAVPRTYSAYATLYMAHAPGSDEAVAIGNDVALLDNLGVAQGAVKLLGEPGLDPTKVLGKVPGRSVSDNIIIVTISGPSATEAVRRANAVSRSFLAFRAKQYNAQNQDIINGLNRQIAALQSQVNSATTTINGSAAGSSQLTNLVQQRAQEEGAIATLQQTQQQDQLDTVSVVQATRILTTGTLIPHSTIKIFVVDALTGMVIGLALGMGFVIFQALGSDRVRRRDDIAALVGAPVVTSTLPATGSSSKKRRARKASSGGSGFSPRPELEPVVRYLGNRVQTVAPHGLLMVAVDGTEQAAIAMAMTAVGLARSNKKVVLVDAADGRPFRQMFGPPHPASGGKPMARVKMADGVSFMLFSPDGELGPEDDRAAWELSSDRWARSDVVLVLANIDLARGAAHLRYWPEAIVAVTAGRSNPQRISATAELLRAAGVVPEATVLFDADKDDDGSGLVARARSNEHSVAVDDSVTATIDWG